MTTRLLTAACFVIAAATLPGSFAPGVVSVPADGEPSGTLTPDGSEFSYAIHRADFSRHGTGRLQRDQVTRAALDYVEGFYEGDTAKLVRALRPELSKYGFWRDSTGKYEGERMTFAEAIAYGKKVKSQNKPAKASWPKDVVVFEVQDQTATAKVTAWWGTDYLLLGKYGGKWMISDVLWQGPLKK